jgi:hypothetical protein
MTLCTAWIKKEGNNEELVFATDSTLTGGEKWNSGVKLFELPRKDCLICFAGYTIRAYPMILNLISELKTKSEMQTHHLDIKFVAAFIAELFTNLIKNLKAEVQNETVEDLAKQASFLFGGWSWQENRFCIWSIKFNDTLKGFAAKEETTEKDNYRIVVFLGNPDELGTKAEKLYQKQMIETGKFDKYLNMEPAVILAELAKDESVREIDGAPQIGKVFRSGTTQFFGIRWKSSKGNPTFLGREYNEINKPQVRYFNPDTFELAEEELPLKVEDINEFATFDDFEFISKCYYQEEGDTIYYLRDNLEDIERQKLIKLFADKTYLSFLSIYNSEKNG